MTKPFRYTITPRGEVRLEMNDTTFFLNRRRSAELLRTINAAVREQGADSGPTAPKPEIIRTREELAALDPDTLVTDRVPAHDAWPGCQVVAFPAPAAHRLDLTWCGPMVVIATDDQARAARQALEEA